MWIVLVGLRTPVAEIREIGRATDPEFKLINFVNLPLPRGIVLYRFGDEQRAPNFQLWIEPVPEDCRVVVLAISPHTQFDTNAILDLEAAVRKLREHGQTLILSGITRHQVKALDGLDMARMMEINNLCPDLEFAIARAIALVSESAPMIDRAA